MSNGFLTSSPGARHGDSEFSKPANRASAQKFTCPGSGPQELTEIGIWVSADDTTTGAFRLAVFTHDATNNNPDTIVANSESAELSHNTTSVTKKSHSYGTKPQLTGGVVYWLAIIHADANINVDSFWPGGVFVNEDAGTYPSWPTASAWDSAEDAEDDAGIYAVYQESTEADAVGVDAMSVTEQIDISPADSGSGSEAQTIDATTALEDAGAGTDAQAVEATLPIAETGAGSDALLVDGEPLLLDTGAGVDEMSVDTESIEQKYPADSGSGEDLLTLNSTFAIAETGAGVDAKTILATLWL